MSSSPVVLRVVGREPDGRISWQDRGGVGGGPEGSGTVDAADWPSHVREAERTQTLRWVWSDTAAWYPALLRAGVTVRRCLDLRLCHTILSRSALVPAPEDLRRARDWAAPPAAIGEDLSASTLFEMDPDGSDGVPAALSPSLAELERQLTAVDGSTAPDRLRMLLAAESVGALLAVEMHEAGIPWDVEEHDRILSEALGPRPGRDQAPARMVAEAARVREALEDPTLVIDSPPRLLKALRRAGIDVSSTSKWELEGRDHPAIGPLLRYKQMHRLLTANGWHWMDEWIHEGRYRPVYVPGGVVTGRWASSGGGALQIPRRLRPCLRADPGWMLVCADVSQLEPRALAALSRDRVMAEAAQGTDLYAGIVEAGIVPTRQEAKVGVLGALYGGTTGDAGRVVARLRQRFTRAMALVDEAAAVGERGGTVSTLLGRSSPPPEQAWSALQREAASPEATRAQQEAARRSARDRGRFTRNFVVQGTAAEWALAWMGSLRTALAALPETEGPAADASGPVFSRRPHLVLFLHDEIIVHTPAAQAEQVARCVRDAAEDAGRLLFPGVEVDFPLDLTICERSAEK